MSDKQKPQGLTEAEIRALEEALTTGTGRYDPLIVDYDSAEPLLDDAEPLCIAVARIKAAARREAHRSALLEAAIEAEAIENDALVAEVAAYVPGEVGRSAAIARRDEMYEDVAGWLRSLAEPERDEESR